MEGRNRTDEIAGHHQIDFRPNRDAVRIEAIVRRIIGNFLDKLKFPVELHYTSRRVAIRASHHRHQKSAFWQSVEFVGDRRHGRISRRQRLGGSQIRHVEEKDFLLTLHDTK